MKLVVWDLDDTVWHGTYMFDGEKVKTCEGIVGAIEQFDRVGVLQSVISRNSPDVYKYVEKLGLNKYFVLPKVSWESKPKAMEQLLNEVHILSKDVLFVDNDIREREAMKLNFPETTCVDPRDIDGYLAKATPSGSNEERKKFFTAEAKRLALGDDFVKMLDLELLVKRPSGGAENDRIVELINRSNQLHATGNRYEAKDLFSKFEIFVGYPKDKYGEYGLSLIAAIDVDEQDRIVVWELVVSCRVMERGLVAPFLRAIEDRLGNEIMVVHYNHTDYNQPMFDILNNQVRGGAGGQVTVPRISYYGKIRTSGDVRVRNE